MKALFKVVLVTKTSTMLVSSLISLIIATPSYAANYDIIFVDLCMNYKDRQTLAEDLGLEKIDTGFAGTPDYMKETSVAIFSGEDLKIFDAGIMMVLSCGYATSDQEIPSVMIPTSF